MQPHLRSVHEPSSEHAPALEQPFSSYHVWLKLYAVSSVQPSAAYVHEPSSCVADTSKLVAFVLLQPATVHEPSSTVAASL